MVVLEHEHARTFGGREDFARDRDAVADRRNERHVTRVRSDEARRRRPRALVLGVSEIAAEFPRLALATDG